MLALGFLLMIGMTLIADGMGFHVPKGYIYAAMGFSALVEGLNMLARRGGRSRRQRLAGTDLLAVDSLGWRSTIQVERQPRRMAGFRAACRRT